jgi:ribosomal protein S7
MLLTPTKQLYNLLKKKKRKKKKKKKLGLTINFLFFTTKMGKKILSFFVRAGNKQRAIKLFYNILSLLTKQKSLLMTQHIIKHAILNSLPFYETRTYTHRGRTILATLPIYSKKRRLFLLFKTIKTYLRTLSGSYANNLALLFFQLSKKQGPFYKNLKKSYMLILKQYPKLKFRWK